MSDPSAPLTSLPEAAPIDSVPVSGSSLVARIKRIPQGKFSFWVLSAFIIYVLVQLWNDKISGFADGNSDWEWVQPFVTAAAVWVVAVVAHKARKAYRVKKSLSASAPAPALE